jgi:hypothetical protein
LRLVISQPAAALYIHEPIFETTVAVHTTVNTRLRNAADNAAGFFADTAPAPLLIKISAAKLRVRIYSTGLPPSMLDRLIAGNPMAELSTLPELGATYGVPLSRALMAAANHPSLAASFRETVGS